MLNICFLLQPVDIVSAVLCIILEILYMFLDAMGDHVVDVYSIVECVMVLQVDKRVSLSFPHCVVVRAFRIIIVFSPFVFVFLTSCPKFSFGSSVRPRILGFLLLGFCL